MNWELKLVEFALDDDATNVRYCAQQVDASLFRLKNAGLLARVVKRHGMCETVLALAECDLVLMHAWAPSGGWYEVLDTEEKVRWAIAQEKLARARTPLCFVIAHGIYQEDTRCALLVEAIRAGFPVEMGTWGRPVHLLQLLVACQNWRAARAVLPLIGPDAAGRLPIDHLSENYFSRRIAPICREYHMLWETAFKAAAASPSYRMEALLARFLQVDRLPLASLVDAICRKICSMPLDYPTLFEELRDAADFAYHRLIQLHPRKDELNEHIQKTTWFRRRIALEKLFDA